MQCWCFTLELGPCQSGIVPSVCLLFDFILLSIFVSQTLSLSPHPLATPNLQGARGWDLTQGLSHYSIHPSEFTAWENPPSYFLCSSTNLHTHKTFPGLLLLMLSLFILILTGVCVYIRFHSVLLQTTLCRKTGKFLHNCNSFALQLQEDTPPFVISHFHLLNMIK